jgi:hypothetical protein
MTRSLENKKMKLSVRSTFDKSIMTYRLERKHESKEQRTEEREGISTSNARLKVRS